MKKPTLHLKDLKDFKDKKDLKVGQTPADPFRGKNHKYEKTTNEQNF